MTVVWSSDYQVVVELKRRAKNAKNSHRQPSKTSQKTVFLTAFSQTQIVPSQQHFTMQDDHFKQAKIGPKNEPKSEHAGCLTTSR